MFPWLVAAALAEEPVDVPMMVPAEPAAGVPGAPDVAPFSWQSLRVVPFRVDLRLGHTIVVTPFAALEDTRCDCDAADLTCAVLDDGSVSVRLADPTRPRPREALGTCVVDGHALSVRGVAPVLPAPFEAAQDRWVVPVRPDERAAHDVMWLPNARAWSPVDDACRLVRGGRRDARVELVVVPSNDWRACVRHRSGRTLEARTLEYRLPWEPTPVVLEDATPPGIPVLPPADGATNPRSGAPAAPSAGAR